MFINITLVSRKLATSRNQTKKGEKYIMVDKIVQVKNPVGLHARPASQLVKAANKFKSEILIEKDGRKYDAKSIIGILSLGAKQGASIKLIANGEDEDDAILSLSEIINLDI